RAGEFRKFGTPVASSVITHAAATRIHVTADEKFTMHPALYIAKTGLSAQDMQLASLSNNLSNVATNGFKRDRVVFEDLLYQIHRQPGGSSTQDTELPSGLQMGTGVRTVGSQKIFTQGALKTTGEP